MITKETLLQKARIIHKRWVKDKDIYVIDIYYKLLEKHNLIHKGYM